jgi:hypothetical protein
MFRLDSMKGRNHSEDLGVDGEMIILEWVLRKEYGLDSSG